MLPSEDVVGGTGNRVRVLHMGIPKGNVHPFIVRGRHIAIGTNPTHIVTLQVPIGNRHALRGFRQTNKPNRGTISPVWNHPTIDPIGTVPESPRLRLKRIIRRTDPQRRSGFPCT